MKYEEMTLEQLQEIIKQQEETIYNLKREVAEQQLIKQELENNLNHL